MNERLDYAPCGILTIDLDGNIIEVNQTLLDWLGTSRQAVVGSHFESLLSIANRLIFYSYFYPTINLYGKVDELIIKLKNQAGESTPYIMNAKKVNLTNKVAIDCAILQMEKRVSYETELKQARTVIQNALLAKETALEKLEQIYSEIEKKQVELMKINMDLIEVTNTDKLTGIYNRKYFQEQMDFYFSQKDFSKFGFSLIMIDIDFFKNVNDTYGHPIGDQVLTQLAQLLHKNARQEDIVTRYGGEEFTIVLPDTGRKQAIDLAQHYKHLVSNSQWPEVGQLTISLGVATYQKADNVEELLKKADIALYHSKNHGRNCVTHYDQLN
ncbi:sensor domain-containing diguanylate cyclase [Kurthia sibirica]|uniref:PAS domain S-box protein n=1 Tax=Kurthia sibirica TaxID=202750 RepID=A0A2U3AMD6_9BACL|nr:sensor domain-containing diguanylate cyclase [Kurthia sibirica]PWI25703.1 PAS domain S-box protein [Kurthia sibirica]GEK33708.1 hypothetical protein KSI01_12410 [Kurthia sibirica]